MTATQKDNLKNLIQDTSSSIKFDEPMKKHTTFKIGGPAECLITVKEIETLKKVLIYAKTENVSITVLGNGSNVLVLDGGIDGITIQIAIQTLKIQDEENAKQTVIVGAGNKVIELAYQMLESSITGMEELSGVPGTIGGAVYMNAGAHGKEMKDIVKEIKCLDDNNNIMTLTNKEAEFGYRYSAFSKNKYIITEVTLELEKGNKDEIKQKMNTYSETRKSSQPIEFPSSGSTFKRGSDFITAKLIDDAGLKGYSIGGAEVSTKHAGFVINKGNATAKDVLNLTEHVEKVIYENFGKKIELEMKIIGRE